MDELTFPALAQKITTEADAYRFLEDLRWKGQPVCPHCGSAREPYFLTPKNGESRKTRTGSASQRRVWKCAEKGCRKQFSVLTGTIFHGTKVPIRTWVFVIFDACSAKNGISAREVERKYGLSTKTAWFLVHRIREAMKREPMAGLLTGRVVADETWIGGKPSNRHGHKTGTWRHGVTDKQPVMALISRETGEVRTQAIPDVKAENLRAVLDEHVDPANTHLHTDNSIFYPRIAGDFASHSAVDHKAGEYVRGDVSTNQAEAFFSQLKRSIDGTHHHVSREHLDRYLAEFEYRFSTCKLSDTERMQRLLGQVAGRRLRYRSA